MPGILLALQTMQWNLFNVWKLHHRKFISKNALIYIDKILYKHKLQTIKDSEMKYVYEGILYEADMVKNARLTTKNNNGLIYLTDIFQTMYADAVFFGLVRDPVALYESYNRRGLFRSVKNFTEFYNRITDTMIMYEREKDNYHIVRFEDILKNPIKEIHRIYKLANLDYNKLTKLRLKEKPHYMNDGSYRTKKVMNRHYWLPLDRLNEIIEPNINYYQIDRIRKEEQRDIKSATYNACLRFDYL